MNRLAALVLCAYLAMMVIAFASAWTAMISTPEAPSFRQFVEPTSTKIEGKISYLYAPCFFQLFGVVLYSIIWIRNPERLSLRLFFVLLAFEGVFMLIGLSNATKAIAAAEKIGFVHEPTE